MVAHVKRHWVAARAVRTQVGCGRANPGRAKLLMSRSVRLTKRQRLGGSLALPAYSLLWSCCLPGSVASAVCNRSNGWCRPQPPCSNPLVCVLCHRNSKLNTFAALSWNLRLNGLSLGTPIED